MGATIGALIGVGFDGEDGMEAGAVGRRGGRGRALIPDSEMYDVADSIAPGTAAAMALIEHCGQAPFGTRSPVPAESRSAIPGSIPLISSTSG